jgi:hypothetical protein
MIGPLKAKALHPPNTSSQCCQHDIDRVPAKSDIVGVELLVYL